MKTQLLNLAVGTKVKLQNEWNETLVNGVLEALPEFGSYNVGGIYFDANHVTDVTVYNENTVVISLWIGSAIGE